MEIVVQPDQREEEILARLDAVYEAVDGYESTSDTKPLTEAEAERVLLGRAAR